MKIIALSLLAACALSAADTSLRIPFEKYKLPNGLRIVLAHDTALPLVTVYTIYDVGSRSEDKGHTGYANILGHLMFEGSAGVKPGEHRSLISSAGGEANGSAHLDYSDYYETVSSNCLALSLWLEADRMRGLAITDDSLRKQQETVAQDRQRIIASQAYQSAIAERWPALIFTDPRDTHSVPGLPEDVQAATAAEVEKFYKTYYSPGNAVLVIAGDFDPPDAKKLVSQYFADIPAQPVPKRAEIKEAERFTGKAEKVKDPLARLPALLIGWPAPPRHSPDWYALCMIDVLLTSGADSRLRISMFEGHQSLLQGDSNLGWPAATPPDFRNPAYYTALLIHKPNFSPDEILQQYQREIDTLARDGVGITELERARAVLRFSAAGSRQTQLNRARLLGIHEITDGDAGFADKDYAAVLAVTGAQIQAAARKWLPAARRDSLAIEPGAK